MNRGSQKDRWAKGTGLITFLGALWFAFSAGWRVGVAMIFITIAHDIYDKEKNEQR